MGAFYGLLSTTSKLAIAAALPLPRLVLRANWTGQPVDFEVARWGDCGTDPVQDLKHWRNRMLRG